MTDETLVRSWVIELDPSLADVGLRRSGLGAEREVWYVGREHVLRIARGAYAEARIRVERAVLDRLDGALLPVLTPRVVAVSQDGSRDLCLKAPGEPLDWREWTKLPRERKQAICAPMGRLVAALHDAIPASEARALGVPDQDAGDVEALRDSLRGRLSSERQHALLETVVAVAPELSSPAPSPVLLHNDLSHHNLAFEAATGEISGVFDFAGSALGDFHRDLRYDPGIEIGDDAMVRSYEEATERTVSRGRQRAWHAWSALTNLMWSLANEDEVLQSARWGWVDAVAAWDLHDVEDVR